MRYVTWGSAVLFLSLAQAAACSSGDTSGAHDDATGGQAGASSDGCTQGDTQSCEAVADGEVCSGVQVCIGASWAACECGSSGTGGDGAGTGGGNGSGGDGGNLGAGAAGGSDTGGCTPGEFECAGATLSACELDGETWTETECASVDDCRAEKGRCACPAGTVVPESASLTTFDQGDEGWALLVPTTNTTLAVVNEKLEFADVDGHSAAQLQALAYSFTHDARCFDASAYDGIALSVTSENAGTFRFVVTMPETLQSEVGGVCDPQYCNENPYMDVTFTAGQTQLVQLTFDSLTLQDWGLTTNRLRHLVIAPLPANLSGTPAYKLTLDDVTLF